MNDKANTTEMESELADLLTLYRETFGLIERENRALREDSVPLNQDLQDQKKRLLLRLGVAVARLRQLRQAWQALDPAERAHQPEVPMLLRQNQELVMRIIVLDRENEQILLRRGLMPSPLLTSTNRLRPGYVAGAYKRHDST